MKNILIGISLAVLAAGSAYAVENNRPHRSWGDTDGDGVFSRAEAQASAERFFARLDVNKDGKLDQGDREARRNAHFDRLDADKNGQLSRAEFSARPARPEGAAAAPGDKPHRGWRGGHRGGHRGAHFAGANGPVTQAEFTSKALQRFDAVDANKDGRVTAEERQAHRAQKRAEHREGRAARHAPAPAPTPAP